MSCSCIIGRTLPPDRLHALDEALRAGASSLGELATSYGITKPTLGRHRLACLGLAKAHEGRFKERPAPTPAPSRDGGETARDDQSTDRDGPPRARAEPSQDRAVASSHETAETARDGGAPRIDASALGAGLVHPEALGIAGFGPQVRFVADMLTSGAWKDRRSVKALAAAWGLGHDAIHERHRAASVLAGTDRGGTAEQLENTIGLVTMGAEECEAAAAKLENPSDSDGNPRPASEDEIALALKYRALGAKNRGVRMRLEGLLVSRVSVSLEADPRIVGMMRALWTALGEVDASLQEQRQVHEQRVRSFIAAVEKITSGPLPEEVLALVAGGESIPSVADTVDLAVKRYEEQTGGRAPGRLEA